VVHDRVGYLAWGNGAIWTSPDGAAWLRAPDLSGVRAIEIAGVARLGDLLVAIGHEEVGSDDGVVRELRTWTSADGRTWRSVTPVTSAPWDGYTSGLTAGEDDSVVAWGYVRNGDHFRPASLRSTDGLFWVVGGHGLRIEGWARDGVWDMTSGDGRLVAVGHGLEGEAGSPPPSDAAWTSPDGLAWTPAALAPDTATGGLFAVARDGDRLVALGRSDVDTTTWLSADGTV
jgi:hypothetical protein